MAGFIYDVSGNDSSVFRQVLALQGVDRETHVGTFNIPANTEGIFPVTGTGFIPSGVMILSINSNQFNGGQIDHAIMNIGFGDGQRQWASTLWMPHITHDKTRKCKSTTSGIITNIGNSYDDTVGSTESPLEAELISMDTNGFTLDITVETEQLVVCIYMAMRGGNFYCDTNLSPTTSGIQTITGLGFKPTTIFATSYQATELDVVETFGARQSIGAAVKNGGFIDQYAIWSGSTSGDVYVDQISFNGALIPMWQDTDENGPFDPFNMSTASVVSFDEDGFTLEWLVENEPEKYYSWWATDGESELQRWTYIHPPFQINDPFLGGLGVVDTLSTVPKGLIFFCLDDDTDTQDYSGGTQTSANALGICDADLNQYMVAFYDMTTPAFRVPQSARYIGFEAFGSWEKRHGGILGTTPDTPHNHGILVELTGPEEIIVPIHLSRIKYRAFQDGDV